MSNSVDITPYLNNKWYVRAADALWRGVFQPIESAFESLGVAWTRRFCEENIPSNERV